MEKVIKQGVKTKVLMLSATPVNNRFIDLRNQLALAYEGSHVDGMGNEAMDSLSVEDRMSVIRIRNKTYYLNRIEEYKKEIRRLEER